MTWENKDQPAYPQPIAKHGDGQVYSTGERSYGKESGFTKFEELSARMMQGLLSAWGQHDVTCYRDMAHDAALAADALLEEWEKRK